MRQDEQLYRRILGLRFFIGAASESVRQMKQHGGLLVVPAAPTLKDLPTHSGYREALLGADLAITDSALMVLVWRCLHGEKLRRTSGLEYLKELLKDREMASGNTFWIMANPFSAARNLDWLASHGIPLPKSHVYLAPIYHGPIDDPALLRCLWRPQSYVPRYWAARKLVALMIRYRDELPPSKAA
jgi:N-acetylglucosaminyldiphosphoundecaprenol N-acetyl-beta-D-mannosaminyltransferase